MAGVDNSIHTDMFFWTTSGEVILMSVLGGINQFFGPFIGALILILLEDLIGAKTQFWPIFLGTIIMIFVIVFPKGVVGEIRHLSHRWRTPGEAGGRHETHASA
jgi:branched-chain amino acid transport system permease protein